MKHLDYIQAILDDLFSIDEWENDPAMSRWVPLVYQKIGFDFSRVLEKEFCKKFNGLMLRSSETIARVYCATFPKQKLLLDLLSRPTENALLILHHPIDLEVSGRGFLPINPEILGELSRRGISVYSCHAPMDCHDDIGTTASIAEAFNIKIETSFAKYGRGDSGRMGTTEPIDLQSLIKKGLKIFGVDRAETGGARLNTVSRIAIVAGGGDDPRLFESAEDLGAQVYLTGEWFTRTKPEDDNGRTWAEANRAACFKYVEKTRMAFLGFSHAATEYLVLRKKMAPWLENQGIDVTCLPQSDWWE